jgi:hypothetical protein
MTIPHRPKCSPASCAANNLPRLPETEFQPTSAFAQKHRARRISRECPDTPVRRLRNVRFSSSELAPLWQLPPPSHSRLRRCFGGARVLLGADLQKPDADCDQRQARRQIEHVGDALDLQQSRPTQQLVRFRKAEVAKQRS